MKKVIFLVFGLLISIGILFAIGCSYETNESKTGIAADEKVYWEDDVDGNFLDDSILVTLTKAASTNRRASYGVEFFPELVGIKEIICLSGDFINLIERQLEASRSGNYEGLEAHIRSNMLISEEGIKNFRRTLLIKFREGSRTNIINAIRTLEREREDIIAVEPNYILQACSFPTNPPTTHLNDQLEVLNRMSFPQAWEIAANHNSSEIIRIGILDSGIQASHPSFAGLIDTNLSRDFVYGGTSGLIHPYGLQDPDGHGTASSGVILTNGIGIIGAVGLNSNIKLVSLRVLNENNNLLDTPAGVGGLINAIGFAANNNIPILNASLGYERSLNVALKNAIEMYMGIFICGAGNGDANTDNPIGRPIYFHYPSVFSRDLDNVISVAATTFDESTGIERRALHPDSGWGNDRGSNWGKTTVSLSAIGTAITSTNPIEKCTVGTCYTLEHISNGYHWSSGTSIATPFVTAACAMIKSIHPNMSPKMVKQIIMDNVDVIPALNGLCASNGRLNIGKAVAAAAGIPKFITGTLGYEYPFVGGGIFARKGSGFADPMQNVFVNDFYMGKHQVTQELWYDVMEGTIRDISLYPSYFKSLYPWADLDKRPVENITWHEALIFCNRLSVKEGLEPVYSFLANALVGEMLTTNTELPPHYSYNGHVWANWGADGYRLPTEAEWEYAARDDQVPANYTLFAGSDIIGDVAWWTGNSGNITREVGLKEATKFGLFDITGNVNEWCWDRYGLYPPSSPDIIYNPEGPDYGINRVYRGGSYSDSWNNCGVAYRRNTAPGTRSSTIGFRVVRIAETVPVYTITFHKNDGSSVNETAKQYIPENTNVSLRPNTFNKDNHTFIGWSTTSTGSAEYTDEENLSSWSPEDMDLYAVWTVNQYTITFDANGGVGAHPSKSVIYGESMPALAGNLPAMIGFYFTGYFDAQTGGTMYYDADLEGTRNWDKSNDTLLYAQWIMNHYEIGDAGPAGGIVFYDKGDNLGGWRYLEAAPSETEFYLPWVPSYYNWHEVVGSSETYIGAGKQNTQIIVDFLNDIGEFGSEYAAQYCANMDFGGFNDWFLPSFDELWLMCENLHLNALGDFQYDWYWSSTDHSSSVLSIDFNSIWWYYYDKDGGENIVRAVRAF